MKKEDVPLPLPISQRKPLDTITNEKIWEELLSDGLYSQGFDPVRLQFAMAILSVRWKKSAESLWKELNGQIVELGGMDMNKMQTMLTTIQEQEGMT